MIYAIFSFISSVFVWKMVPETNGQTLEEMAHLWKKGYAVDSTDTVGFIA